MFSLHSYSWSREVGCPSALESGWRSERDSSRLTNGPGFFSQRYAQVLSGSRSMPPGEPTANGRNDVPFLPPLSVTRQCPQIQRSRRNTLSHNPVPVPVL